MRSSLHTIYFASRIPIVPAHAFPQSIIYADCIIGKSEMPGWHYKEARLTLINFVLDTADPAWLVKWSSSQSTRGDDDDPKRVPANDLRKAVRAHFQQMVTEGPGR